MKKSSSASAAALVGLVVLLLMLDFCGYHKIFGRVTELDIASGRIRTTRYFLFCPIVRSVEEGKLFRIANENNLLMNAPEWVVAVRRPLLRRKPEALSAAKLLNSTRNFEGFLDHVRLSQIKSEIAVSNYLNILRERDANALHNFVDDLWRDIETPTAPAGSPQRVEKPK